MEMDVSHRGATLGLGDLPLLPQAGLAEESIDRLAKANSALPIVKSAALYPLGFPGLRLAQEIASCSDRIAL
jgi:hypothetical protein